MFCVCYEKKYSIVFLFVILFQNLSLNSKPKYREYTADMYIYIGYCEVATFSILTPGLLFT